MPIQQAEAVFISYERNSNTNYGISLARMKDMGLEAFTNWEIKTLATILFIQEHLIK